MNDAKRQNIDCGCANVPLCTVNSQHPGFRNSHPGHDYLGNDAIVQFKRP